MKSESLIPPADFVGLDAVTHLCTGGEAPWLRGQSEVYAEFAQCKSGGGPWTAGHLRPWRARPSAHGAVVGRSG